MTSVGDRIVEFARQQIGEPYVWGAEGPDSWDCSGLVYGAYKAAGLDVSRTTAANLGRQGQPVSAAAAVPGDVVYYDRPGATDHVGIYIGNGQMVNAPQAGQPVSVAAIGSPTSIRRMPGITDDGSSVPLPRGTLETDSGGGGILGVFDGWAEDLRGVAMKIVAATAAAALVIVGAKATLQDRKA